MAEFEKVIIDASVVVKWFSKEEGTEAALALKEDHIEGKLSLVAPDLLLYEIANALRYRPDFDKSKVEEAMDGLLGMQIELVPQTKQLIKKCLEVAFRYGITIYDASYVALGELLSMKVLTSDGRLYRKTERNKFVILL